MNKQPTTIRAYLLRGAFLLSLAFVIVMPLALGQTRSGGSKPSVAAAHMPQVAPPSAAAISGGPAVPALPASQLPETASGPAGAHRVHIPPLPQFPQVVLYDQLNNPGSFSTLSQEFPDLPTFNSDLADDFVVPAGQTWNITEVDAQGLYFNGAGPADNFNVRFYQNSGTLPGTLVYTATGQSYVNNAGVFQVTLTVP